MSDIKVYTANINDLWEIPSDEVGMANSSQFVKFTDFYKLTKENAQLKADNSELVDMLGFLASTCDMRSDIYAAVKELVHKELVQKHKEQNNA